MYADDTSLCHMSNISKLESAINEDLELLDNWLKGIMLSLNVAKTKSMLICTKSRRKILNNNDNELNLQICDRELDSVDVIKYLGVHVDDSLSWKDHLKSVTSKVSRGIGILKQAKYYLPEACLFEYCGDPTFGIAALFGEPALLLKSTTFKNFKTERLELSPTANLML